MKIAIYHILKVVIGYNSPSMINDSTSSSWMSISFWMVSKLISVRPSAICMNVRSLIFCRLLSLFKPDAKC